MCKCINNVVAIIYINIALNIENIVIFIATDFVIMIVKMVISNFNQERDKTPRTTFTKLLIFLHALPKLVFTAFISPTP